MLDAKARPDQERLANPGIHRPHMLIKTQIQILELSATTFAEIQEVNRIPFGAILQILKLLGKNVIQLVLLYLRMLMTLPNS